MRKASLVVFLSVALAIVGTAYAANTDDFNGPNLAKMWTYRDPASKGTVSFSGGKLVLDLKAGADMYIAGFDAGVMFLTNPPDTPNFSIETMINAAVKGTQPPACHVGIVLFNEAKWAYSAWGPYNAGQDIRLEDCVGGSYRWRDQIGIAVDVGDVAIDKDVYLKVVKTGNNLECFAKGSAGGAWVSGGVDSVLGPNYTPGSYKIGLIAKSWGGSVDSTFEFDYFNVPELSTTAVDLAGKLATKWAEIKN